LAAEILEADLTKWALEGDLANEALEAVPAKVVFELNPIGDFA
jgi:hypothetical protein